MSVMAFSLVLDVFTMMRLDLASIRILNYIMPDARLY